MYETTSLNNQNSLFKYLSQIPKDLLKSPQYLLTIKKNSTHILFKFHKPVYISSNHGQALLIVCQNPENVHSFKKYVLQGSIEIPAGVYFNTISITDTCSIYLQAKEKDLPSTFDTLKTISTIKYASQVSIDQLISYTNTNLAPHQSVTEIEQDYYQLLIPYTGSLSTEIADYKFELKKNQVLLVFPKQIIKLQHLTGDKASYLSFNFYAKGLDRRLANRVFNLFSSDIQYIKEIQALNFENKTDRNQYQTDKILSFIYGLLIRILRQEEEKNTTTISSMRSNYESDLFKEMEAYLKNNIESKNEVSDLVEKFDLSRSTVQKLFKKHANTTPKSYINQIRLHRSKELMKDSQLTISEIAKSLGFGSIQYFSRAFSKEFGMSPSIYAKSINH